MHGYKEYKQYKYGQRINQKLVNVEVQIDIYKSVVLSKGDTNILNGKGLEDVSVVCTRERTNMARNVRTRMKMGKVALYVRKHESRERSAGATSPQHAYSKYHTFQRALKQYQIAAKNVYRR